jgi:hypothetical protein
LKALILLYVLLNFQLIWTYIGGGVDEKVISPIHQRKGSNSFKTTTNTCPNPLEI